MTARKTLWLVALVATLWIGATISISANGQTTAPEEHASLRQQIDELRQRHPYSEALPLAQRQLELAEKEFGTEHLTVAESSSTLATLYANQGRYADAGTLVFRVLAIREKILGPEHPHVATTLNNLAVLYEYQGRFRDAEPILRRALAIDEKSLGSRHPQLGR